MAKAEAKEGEGTSEPLNCKTWVLRVSLHCEGCKRKVKKILQNINGVHGVEIELKQHKVTVTTSTDAETLIKKLAKAGKHAEPWPEKKPGSKTVKHKPTTPSETAAGETTAENKKQPAETEVPLMKEVKVQDPSKNEEKGGTSGNAEAPEISKAGEGGGGTADNNGGGVAEQVEESPPEVKQTPTLQNATQSLEGGGGKSNAGETQPGGPSGAVVVEVSGGGGGGGGEGKKKKKKGQKKGKSGGVGGGVEVVTQTIPAPANTGSSPPLDQHDEIPAPNHSPPRNHPYHYPVHAFVSQPAYVACYNTTHPSSSYGPYYASPPPYSYAYVHSPAVPRDISPPPQAAEQTNSPPSNPFDFFSDENPSGCSVM